MENQIYDTVIVGAGGTGLAAGMYAGRLGLRTIVFGTSTGTEMPIGGVITLTNVVENYPGYIHLTGEELAKKLEEHAREYNIEIETERVTTIDSIESDLFKVVTDKRTVTSKTIIFATGTKWRQLTMPGAKEFENKGVSYCALCDGPLFRKKIVAVVGGSDTAAKEALLLAEYADKVYIVYRGETIRPEPVNARLIEKNKIIEVLTQTNITEIAGDTVVKKIVLDRAYNGSNEITVHGVFGAIGHIPLSELAISLGVTVDKKNEVVINRNSETNIPGVFAAGDVVDTIFKQSITGVAEGVLAAYSAYTFIKKSESMKLSDDEK